MKHDNESNNYLFISFVIATVFFLFLKDAST